MTLGMLVKGNVMVFNTNFNAEKHPLINHPDGSESVEH
jgi:hypothetical protein